MHVEIIHEPGTDRSGGLLVSILGRGLTLIDRYVVRLVNVESKCKTKRNELDK